MFEQYISSKKAFIFELDNVLYPEKDYLLQVYYLFSEFLSYTEQLDASAILAFMQAEFVKDGSEDIFERTATKFQIPAKYKENFELLHQNARLPLKLLMYEQLLTFLQEIVVERKEVYLLIEGDPLQQINKIKQMEWHGLESYLITYFRAEFEPHSFDKALDFILDKHQLRANELLIIGAKKQDQVSAENYGIQYLNATEII